MSYSSAIIQQVNSPVSYPDLLGFYFGLTRFVGETNVNFLQRLYRSTSAIKDTSAKGLIDTLSLNLNLKINKAISITGPVGATIIVLPGILYLNGTAIQLFTLADDTYIVWKQLSDVVASINSMAGFTATLLISDRPALTICKQTNLNINLNEVVSTTDLVYTVKNAGLIADNIIFNNTPPSYTISGDNLIFTSNSISGLQISYQNVVSPYVIVASDINLIGLNEPNLIAAATNNNNVLGYQLREAIQKIMNIDRSYWVK